MTTEATITDSTSPFADLAVDPEQVLGSRTFEDVLYDPDEAAENIAAAADHRGVDPWDPPDADEAHEFATSLAMDDKPWVGTTTGLETMKNYNAAAATGTKFHHPKIVGSNELASAYESVWESDRFDVTVEPDYEAGDLTITVEAVGDDA